MLTLQRRTVLSGAIAGAALLQRGAYPPVWSEPDRHSLERPTPAGAAAAGECGQGSRAGRTWTRGSHRTTNGSALPTMIVQYRRKAWHWTCPGRSATTTMTLGPLKALPRQEVIFTLECSGDNGLPFCHQFDRQCAMGGRVAGETTHRRRRSKTMPRSGVLRNRPGREVVRLGTPLEYKYTSNFAREHADR